jgi:hypothetical protein
VKRILLVCLLCVPALAFAQNVPNAVPAGTILPVQLNSSLSSAKSRPGDKVTARIMQDIPLPDGSKVHARSRVLGHVVSVAPASSGASGKIAIQFDTLEVQKRALAITTNLRAIASMLEVDEAETPKFSPDYGTPSAAYPTVQIGGETVYRGGGHVMHGSEVVGEPVVSGGVLATIRTRPGTPCRGAIDGNTAPQALWVFSSDACGV